AGLAARLVGPVHGELDDLEARTARAQQKLDVEAEALDRHLRKERVRRRRGERFESTLAVVNPGKTGAPDDPVEESSGHHTVRARLERYGGVQQAARADRNIGAGRQGCFQALELRNRRGSVGVGEEPPVAARHQHPLPHGGALALVAATADHADLRVAAPEAFHDIRSLVSATVVDDDHLVRLTTPIEVGNDGVEVAWQAVRLVVGRNDHGPLERGPRARIQSRVAWPRCDPAPWIFPIDHLTLTTNRRWAVCPDPIAGCLAEA